MRTQTYKNTSAGFSLIELLIVIAIIMLLITVTLPGLMVTKERGKRTVCLANIHQFILGLQVYADSNKYHFPEMSLQNTFELSELDYDVLADNIGSDKPMFCPSLGKPFARKEFGTSGGSSQGDDRGYYIGYNYLGGHMNTPWSLVQPATREWESAQTSYGKVTIPIITELNVWSVYHDKTVAPHGNRGAYRLGGDYMNTGLGGITSGQIGATGGNIGFTDGSGHWEQIDEENIYRVSNNSQDIGWFSTW